VCFSRIEIRNAGSTPPLLTHDRVRVGTTHRALADAHRAS
jgi:hypothetical protein